MTLTKQSISSPVQWTRLLSFGLDFPLYLTISTFIKIELRKAKMTEIGLNNL